jgi:hypothetical protein
VPNDAVPRGSTLALGVPVPIIRQLIVLAAILGSLWSCHAKSYDSEPGLTQFVDSVTRNSSPLNSPFSVAAEVVNPYSTVAALRFRLSNISQQQQVVEQGSMPWENAWLDSVTGVTVHGKVLRISPACCSHIRPDHPAQVVIAPGETLVGEMARKNLYPLDYNPRDQDVLLLWEYRQGKYSYTGITLLPKR